MKTTFPAKLALCLTLFPTVFAQFFGATGRFHPLYAGQNNAMSDMLAVLALGGLESNDLLLLNLLYGNGMRMGPAPVRQQQQHFQRTLSLLGVLDGADVPDAQGAQGRGGRRRGGAKKPRGGGGGRQVVEEPAGGAGGRRGKRGKKRRGGAAAQ